MESLQTQRYLLKSSLLVKYYKLLEILNSDFKIVAYKIRNISRLYNSIIKIQNKINSIGTNYEHKTITKRLK